MRRAELDNASSSRGETAFQPTSHHPMDLLRHSNTYLKNLTRPTPPASLLLPPASHVRSDSGIAQVPSYGIGPCPAHAGASASRVTGCGAPQEAGLPTACRGRGVACPRGLAGFSRFGGPSARQHLHGSLDIDLGPCSTHLRASADRASWRGRAREAACRGREVANIPRRRAKCSVGCRMGSMCRNYTVRPSN